MTEKCVRREWRLVGLNPLIFEMNPLINSTIFVIDRWRSNRLSIICNNRADRCDYSDTWLREFSLVRRWFLSRDWKLCKHNFRIRVKEKPAWRRPTVRSPLLENSGEMLEVNLRYDASLVQPVPHPQCRTYEFLNQLSSASFRFLSVNFSRNFPLKLR